MNDKKFQEAINKAALKLNEYHSALNVAEREYVRRYGEHPSDIDDDGWIDAIHVTGSSITVDEVEENFKLHRNT